MSVTQRELDLLLARSASLINYSKEYDNLVKEDRKKPGDTIDVRDFGNCTILACNRGIRSTSYAWVNLVIKEDGSVRWLLHAERSDTIVKAVFVKWLSRR